MINDHKQFLYHEKFGAKVFDEGDEIPSGWFDSPDFKNARHMSEDVVIDAEPTDIVPDVKKYPSQMNKSELIELGISIGVDLDESMTKSKMLEEINGKINSNGE